MSTTALAVRAGSRSLGHASVAGVVGAAATLWGLSIGLGELTDNSFLTHLATGRLILEEGIPRTDPYSWTAPGEPWVVQSWLVSAVYGVVDRWWGGDGLVLLHAALTAVLAGMVYRLTRPLTLVGRVLVAALVLGVGAVTWTERPLLFGLVLLGAVLLATDDVLDPRWLLPAMWAWVNVHGSFPLGLVAIALLAAGRRLDGEHPRVELRALRWAVAGVLLGAANPLGPRLLWFPVELLARSDILGSVTEWQSPSFTATYQRVFLVQLLAAVVLLARRPSWRAALPIAVFGAAALVAARNLPVASVALVPAMVHGLRGLGTIEASERSPLATAGVLAMALLGGLFVADAVEGPAFDLRRYPRRELAWVADRGWLGPGLAAPEVVGNYLEAVEGRHAEVFFDDRFDMYPEDLIRDVLVLEHGDPGWQEVLDRYGIGVVLWESGEPLGQLLVASSDWRIELAGEEWLVAVRRSAASP